MYKNLMGEINLTFYFFYLRSQNEFNEFSKFSIFNLNCHFSILINFLNFN